MSIVKKVNTPYVIHTINPDHFIILDSNNVIINGNLDVRGTGTNTIIETINTTVYDNMVQLNAGDFSDPPNTSLTAGIEIFRGNARPTMQIRWKEGLDSDGPPGWQASLESQISPGTYAQKFYYFTTYDPLLGGFNMANVASDLNPYLGGNLDTGNLAIWSSNVGDGTNTWSSNVQINSNLALQKYMTTTTSVTPDHITMTAGNVGTGGTGLFVTADEQGVSHEELISKRRAIIYSIIF